MTDLNDLKQKFARFMVGRYGSDELNQALFGTVLVLIVISFFVRSHVFLVVELLLLVLACGRMFSKNTARRFQGNQRFLDVRFRALERWRKIRERLKDGRKYKIFKCPNCGQKLRIPRGHGKIRVRCRKCGHEFEGRS